MIDRRGCKMASRLHIKIITEFKRHQKKPNSIIPFPVINQSLTWLFHCNKQEREEVLNELRAQKLIDIIPFHGIRLLNPTAGNDTSNGVVDAPNGVVKLTLEIQQRLLNAANLAKINLNALFTKSLKAEFSEIYGNDLDKTKQKLAIEMQKLQNDVAILESLDPTQKTENPKEKPPVESKLRRNGFKGARELPALAVERNCPFAIVIPIPKKQLSRLY